MYLFYLTIFNDNYVVQGQSGKHSMKELDAASFRHLSKKNHCELLNRLNFVIWHPAGVTSC